MKGIKHLGMIILFSTSFTFSACSTTSSTTSIPQPPETSSEELKEEAESPDYSSRLPQQIKTHEKTVLIDPNVHAWGAYDKSGELIRSGLATSGGEWCEDVGRPCKTKSGTFRIYFLGDANCKSSIYPLPKGGAPMPYCMYFNRNQGLHGSAYVMEDNVSHGCVRMQVEDAEWLRHQFVNNGTKVIVRPY